MEKKERELWLAERRKGIGGSDIAKIMGLSKWGSPLSVFLDKKGLLPPQEDNELMEIGREIEDFIAHMYTKRTGLKVRRCNRALIHKKYDFIRGNIDRLITGKRDMALECKNANAFRSKDFDDQIPDDYMLQCQHYMAITDKKLWDMAVLVGGNQFKYFSIPRDDELIKKMEDTCIDFWNTYIIPNVAPKAMAGDTKYLTDLYPDSNSETMVLDFKYYKDLERFEVVKQDIKQLKEEEGCIKAIIQQQMKENEFALCDDLTVSWKTIITRRVDNDSLKRDNLYHNYLNSSSSRRLTVK